MIEEVSLGGDHQAGLRWLLVSESQKTGWTQAQRKAEGLMDTAREVNWNLFIGNL